MKYKGCTTYMQEERDEDLLATFERILRSNQYRNIADVYKAVAESPAKRFWVTDRRAYEVVVRIHMGISPRMKPYPLRREMYNEIYRRCREMMAEKPGLRLRDAVTRVVEQPAPKFYLSPGCIKNTITRLSHWKRPRRDI